MESLKVMELTKRFGDFTAVDDISFSVRKGEIFGLLGQNGAGKTTTINIIVGLLSPTSGTVHVNGYNILTDPLDARRSLGLLPDNVGVFPNLTARQNLNYFSELADVPRDVAEERIEELLELVKLENWGNVRVDKYSRGMKQRLGIAQSLIRDPQLLLFDEPTLGIDPEGAQDMRGLILKLAKEQGKTILITTHLLREVSEFFDHVAIMKRGKIIGDGSIIELRRTLGVEEAIGLDEIFLRFQREAP